MISNKKRPAGEREDEPERKKAKKKGGKKKEKVAVLLAPRLERPCGWVWPGLEVKESGVGGGGGGLFATVDLQPGTMIPLLGKRLSKTQLALQRAKGSLTHGWIYHGGESGIDGRPEINPYKGVGSFGLAVGMMPNEHTTKKHNCVFKMDHLVTGRKIKAGEELFVYYGEQYEPIRVEKGYSLHRNKHLLAHYPDLDGRKFPSAAERQANFRQLHSLLADCSRRFTKREPLDKRVKGRKITLLRQDGPPELIDLTGEARLMTR